MNATDTHRAATLAQPARCALCGSNTSQHVLVTMPGLSIDLADRRVWVAGRELRLTVKEFDVLTYFAERADTLVTKKQLYDDVWRFPVLPRSTRTMESHVSRLRCKVAAVESSTLRFENVRGVGWRFRAR